MLVGRGAQEPVSSSTGFERVEVRQAARPQVDGPELGGWPAETSDHDGFVFLRLARTGRIDQPAARGERRPRRCESSSAVRRAKGRDRLPPAPADIGIAAHRSETGTGRIDEDDVELGANGKPASRSACSTRMFRAPLASTVSRSSSHARARERRRRQSRARSPAIAAIAVVFPPGDAQVSSTRMPGSGAPSSATSCDASSWRKNRPVPARGVRKRISGRHDQPVGRVTRRLRPRRHARQATSTSARAVGLQPVHAKRQRRGDVVELLPGFGAARIHSGRAIVRRATRDATARSRDREARRRPAAGAAAAGDASSRDARAAPRSPGRLRSFSGRVASWRRHRSPRPRPARGRDGAAGRRPVAESASTSKSSLATGRFAKVRDQMVELPLPSQACRSRGRSRARDRVRREAWAERRPARRADRAGRH